MYTNPHQYFTSEREFLIGAFTFPTLQDIFKIKESGSKLTTKAQKICFIQQCAEQLEKLPYDSTQLQKIKDFLKKKATEYKIPVESVDAKANYIRHTPSVCGCVECQEFSHLTVSNSIIHMAEIFINTSVC